MRAGALIHLVSLQQRRTATAKDGFGQAEADWAEVGTPWAEIKTLTGTALQRAAAHFASVSVAINIRHRAGVLAGMRVVHAGLTYEIGAVLDPDLRRVELNLLCSAGVAAKGG